MSPHTEKVGKPRPVYWGIVPAAGVGRRMGSDTPKQYLDIRGMSVLEYAVKRLADVTRVTGVVVCVSAGDRHWPKLGLSHPKLIGSVEGGPTRAESVINGLRLLLRTGAPRDWVLVHDAVRPCVTVASIDRLIDEIDESDCGGLLAIPIADTVKRADSRDCVAETVPRERLWRAQTPQMFRLGELEQELGHALARHAAITDEASAMEISGYRPRLVKGRVDNIKVTTPEDLKLAAHYLMLQSTN